jgi:hypothetical protein
MSGGEVELSVVVVDAVVTDADDNNPTNADADARIHILLALVFLGQPYKEYDCQLLPPSCYICWQVGAYLKKGPLLDSKDRLLALPANIRQWWLTETNISDYFGAELIKSVTFLFL